VFTVLAGIGIRVRESYGLSGDALQRAQESAFIFLGRIALPERQITNRDVREIFGISNRAALDAISGLVELKVVKQMGKGRSVHSVLL